MDLKKSGTLGKRWCCLSFFSWPLSTEEGDPFASVKLSLASWTYQPSQKGDLSNGVWFVPGTWLWKKNYVNQLDSSYDLESYKRAASIISCSQDTWSWDKKKMKADRVGAYTSHFSILYTEYSIWLGVIVLLSPKEGQVLKTNLLFWNPLSQ